MNSQKAPVKQAKGNFTTPADERKVNVNMLFGGKNDLVRQVLQASEKNQGMMSSQQDRDSDSESSSDGDIFLEL
jgi:hypothetical protein